MTDVVAQLREWAVSCALPGALALSVKDTVKLGATHRDGSAVRQGDTTAGCINGSDKVAFRHQIRFDEPFDLAHARTTALGTVNVKQIERLQSQERVRIG